MNEKAEPRGAQGASLVARSAVHDLLTLRGRWRMECRRSDGSLRWVEEWENLVTTEGMNTLLGTGLGGVTQIGTWYLLLVDGGSTPTYAAGDTYASHSGWSENTDYSNANRVTWTAGTAASGSIDNSASVAAFSINATATIAGAGLVSNNTKGDTAAGGAKLYAVGSFTGGNRSVLNGDTLNVTATYSLS